MPTLQIVDKSPHAATATDGICLLLKLSRFLEHFSKKESEGVDKKPFFFFIFANFLRFKQAKVSPTFISIRGFPTYLV